MKAFRFIIAIVVFVAAICMVILAVKSCGNLQKTPTEKYNESKVDYDSAVNAVSGKQYTKRQRDSIVDAFERGIK